MNERPWFWCLRGIFCEQRTVYWLEGVFTNSMYNKIEEIANELSHERLLDMCFLFLDATDHVPTLETPGDLSTVRGESFGFVFSCVRKAIRGLTGLACAEPGVCTLEEMQYIYPVNFQHSKGFAKDVPRVGRSIISALRRDGEESKIVWAKLNQEFLSTLGFALQVAQDFQKLKDSVQRIEVKLRTQKLDRD